MQNYLKIVIFWFSYKETIFSCIPADFFFKMEEWFDEIILVN